MEDKVNATDFFDRGFDVENISHEGGLLVAKVELRHHGPAFPGLKRFEIDLFLLEHFPTRVLEVARVHRMIDVPVAIVFIASDFDLGAIRSHTP